MKLSDKDIQEFADSKYRKGVYEFLGREPDNFKKGKFLCIRHKAEFTQIIANFKIGKLACEDCAKEINKASNKKQSDKEIQNFTDAKYGKEIYKFLGRESENIKKGKFKCLLHKNKFVQLISDFKLGKIGCVDCAREKSIQNSVIIQRDRDIQSLADFKYGKDIYKFIGRESSDRLKGKFKCLLHKTEFVQGIFGFKKGSIGCKECVRKKRSNSLTKPIRLYQEKIDKAFPKGLYQIKSKENSCCITICSKHNLEFRWPTKRIPHILSCPLCAGERISKGKTKDLSKLQVDLNKIFGFIKMTSIPNIEYLPELQPKKRKIFLRCNIHNEVYEQNRHNTLKGSMGCPKCVSNVMSSSRTNKTTYNDFITEGKKIHHNLYSYPRIENASYINANSKILIFCKKCERHFSTNYAHHIYRSSGCPCKQWSTSENIINNFLEGLKVNFERQYKVEEYDYRYDFYIPEFNLFIEFDGIQHFKPVEKFGGEKEFLKTIKNDLSKNELAKQQRKSILRISYENNFKRIKEILQEVFIRINKDEVLQLFYGEVYSDNPSLNGQMQQLFSMRPGVFQTTP